MFSDLNQDRSTIIVCYYNTCTTRVTEECSDVVLGAEAYRVSSPLNAQELEQLSEGRCETSKFPAYPQSPQSV